MPLNKDLREFLGLLNSNGREKYARKPARRAEGACHLVHTFRVTARLKTPLADAGGSIGAATVRERSADKREIRGCICEMRILSSQMRGFGKNCAELQPGRSFIVATASL